MVQWLDQMISQPETGRRWDVIVWISWQDFFSKCIEENKIPATCADQCHSTHLERQRRYYCPCQLLTNPPPLPHKENLECVIDAHLQSIITILPNWWGLVKSHRMMDAISAAQLLTERHREKTFLDQEKAFDWVPHELIWYSLCFHGVLGAYAHWVQLL